MAERRMFTKKITESDAFLDMPASTQALYFHLNMNADDDGFVNNPKSIQRIVGASDDDLKLLLAKKFIISFDSGVIVIKHWKMHNYIQSDRYKPTDYIEEKACLELDEKKAYKLNVSNLDTECIQDGYIGKDRLGKDRLGEVIEEPQKRKRFVKPTLDELKDFIFENNLNVDAETFFDYYESNGWMAGKNHMKDWKATVRNWDRREKKAKPKTTGNNKGFDFEDFLKNG